MESPSFRWDQLSFIFEPGVRIPELRGKHQAAKCFGTARIDGTGGDIRRMEAWKKPTERTNSGFA
jgi:hypothetical protein